VAFAKGISIETVVKGRVLLHGLEHEHRDLTSCFPAKADRMLVDEAPIAALVNQLENDFVSARVGNYQHHPQWGILLDQLWVQ
jgi:hypothetical protein